jgi:hypothetical protein
VQKSSEAHGLAGVSYFFFFLAAFFADFFFVAIGYSSFMEPSLEGLVGPKVCPRYGMGNTATQDIAVSFRECQQKS